MTKISVHHNGVIVERRFGIKAKAALERTSADWERRFDRSQGARLSGTLSIR